MEKEQIQRYFDGEATPQEVAELLDWVEASDENRATLSRERLLYDTALFAMPAADEAPEVPAEQVGQSTVWRWMRRAVAVAASVALVVGCTLWAAKLFSPQPPLLTQTVTAPAGQQAQVTLPDGSKVWLNSQTILTYQSDFGVKTRSVSLDGEAYFEVAKDAAKPFSVSTEHNRVEVLGTHFDVCAYRGSGRFKTTLHEGSVDVYAEGKPQSVARLAPLEYYQEVDGVGQRGTIRPEQVDRWQDGILRFDDLPFAEVAGRLGQYYGVKLRVRNKSLLRYRCTGKFKLADGIDHILGVIQKDQPFEYTYSDDRHTIYIE